MTDGPYKGSDRGQQCLYITKGDPSIGDQGNHVNQSSCHQGNVRGSSHGGCKRGRRGEASYNPKDDLHPSEAHDGGVPQASRGFYSLGSQGGGIGEAL